jgi:hypothetical protein
MERHNPTPPRWVWRLTLAGAALVIGVTALGAIWIAGGASDPPVADPVVWSDSALTWASGPAITVAAGEQRWFSAPPEAHLPDTAFTLDVRARFAADAGPGAAWGVWIETPDGARIVYAISDEGYTTTRRCDTLTPQADIEACPALRPEWRWFAYPRLHPPGEANTITLHVEAPGDIRLRLNREIMGIAPLAWDGAWGVWVRGGRASGAVLTWENAEMGHR